jgi:lipopolysaccharide assembly protein A
LEFSELNAPSGAVAGFVVPPQDEAAMRWIYSTVIVLFVAATVVFGAQNLQVVTMSFLRFDIRAPLAILTALFYVLGTATGGSLFALLRKSIRASRAGRPAAS